MRKTSRLLCSAASVAELCLPPMPSVKPGIKGKLLGHVANFSDKNRFSRPEKVGYNMFCSFQDMRQETNSDTFSLNMVGATYIMTADKDIIREVLVEKQNSFTNDTTFRRTFGSLFPNSMIVVEGKDWKRIRRVSQVALNKMNMDVVIPHAKRVLKRSKYPEDGQDFDTFTWLSRVTFDIFHNVMYEFDPETVLQEKNNRYIHLMNSCNDLVEGINYRAFGLGATFPLLWKLPLKENRKIESAKKHIISMASELLEMERIRTDKESPLGEASEAMKWNKARNILHAFVLAEKENEKLSNDEIIDQLATFFFGAYETTSNTLLFVLNHLAEHQSIQEELREHLRNRFPQGSDQIQTLEDLDEVNYLNYVITETNRLDATAHMFGRTVVEDVNIGPYRLKKGMHVIINHSMSARNPEYFPKGEASDLNEFRPNRYENFKMEKLVSMPFGHGGRICPGRRMAYVELKIVLAHLIMNFRISPPSNPSKELIRTTKLGKTAETGTGHLRLRKIS